MMTVNLRIELSGLDKARKELNALLVLIDTLDDTVAETPKLEETAKPKTTRKPRAKAETAKTPVKEPEPTPEPVKEPKAVKSPSTGLSETDVLQTARETGERLGDKTKVKEVISKYGSKISAVKEGDYESLINELKAL